MHVEAAASWNTVRIDLGGLFSVIVQQFTSPFIQGAATNQVSLCQFDVQSVHHCVRS